MNTAVTKFLSIFGINQQYIYDCFELYGKESENRLTKETQGHVTRGFVKAFAAYYIPISIMQRSINFRNVRRAFALGFFVAGVRLIDSVIETIKEERKDVGGSAIGQTPLEKFIDQYSIGISGFISSFIALSIDGKIYKNMVAVLWLALRAIRTYSPSFQFGSLIIMCASSAQVLACLLHYPECLSPNYRKFLYTFSGKTVAQWKSMKNISQPCSVIHANQGCVEHFASFWMTAFVRCFKLYAPIFLLGLLFSTKKSIVTWLSHVCRSSVFLATYTAGAWFSQCMAEFVDRTSGTQIFGPVTYGRMLATTWISGLPMIVESTSRQSELSAYVLTYAIDSLFTMAQEWKYIQNWDPIINLFCMSTATGVLLHNHNQQPKAMIKYLFKFRY